jgi:hypothetical protein
MGRTKLQDAIRASVRDKNKVGEGKDVRENTFVESKSGTTTKVKNDPFWTSLQDMSQLSISALEQLEIEASGSEGTVQRMNYDNMKLWEAGELALGKSL